MRLLLSIAFLAFAACASQTRAQVPERLYFAVEVREQGRLVGKPKLLGETGKIVRVERRQRGSASADYELLLRPAPDGDAYKIQLEVATPRTGGTGELALLHGQERKLELGRLPGDLEVRLLLMRVDSPEFQALMDLSNGASKSPTSI